MKSYMEHVFTLQHTVKLGTPERFTLKGTPDATLQVNRIQTNAAVGMSFIPLTGMPMFLDEGKEVCLEIQYNGKYPIVVYAPDFPFMFVVGFYGEVRPKRPMDTIMSRTVR